MVDPTDYSGDSTDAEVRPINSHLQTPLDALGVLASHDVMITPTLRHAEFFTMRGLLTLMWHEPPDATPSHPVAIIACGGAMGGAGRERRRPRSPACPRRARA